jgi:hypothetical protein
MKASTLYLRMAGKAAMKFCNSMKHPHNGADSQLIYDSYKLQAPGINAAKFSRRALDWSLHLACGESESGFRGGYTEAGKHGFAGDRDYSLVR